ncbi:hypothetical protein FSP39_002068 [Pinctada imbricata]|uniref:Nephrocystin 3-like N-terminal domain-containing protein n=1 Tax=Pinctada imbricata TaxID=66713 RepID=A0AA88XQ33_PINIB|nr:hypothetical protein FSP39_002068 [Pinctada imbricata]
MFSLFSKCFINFHFFTERIWTPGQPSFFFTSHADFVGREWLKRKIRDYLNQGTNGVILVAEPGFGKSAVVANFIQTYEDNGNLSLLGYHICQHDSRLSLDVSNFIINLWRSLRKKYVDFNAEIPTTLKRENDMKSYCTMDPIYCFQELIAHPLKSVNISKRSLYIIDAIDECQQSSFGWSISELLINKHKFLIPPLSIFMTSRNKSTLLQRFRTFKQLHVEPNSSENKGDLKQFIRYKAGSDYNRNVLDDMTNFLILRHYLFNFHDTHAERIKRVYEIYDFEFSRLYGNGFSRKYAIDRSFFEVLCTNLLIDDSLTLNIMKEVLKYSYPSPDDEEFEKMIDRVTTNIVRLWEKDGIKTIHSSLFDWLKFKKNKNFLVNIKRGHYLWAMYLFNKLKTNSIKPIINQYERNKIMTQTMSLVDHYVLARNESLQNELLTGKFKIPDIRLSCLSCLSALPSIPMFYNGTISHVEYAVYHFYEYNIFKTLILLSRTTNWTKEAFMAFHCDNTGAFTAFLEFGHVDFKQKHVIVDTWRTFGNTNMPGIEYDLNREENVDGERLSRKQMLLNVVGNITVEYMSIFHLMMMKNQLQELHSVVSRDKSVLGEKTGNGWDVFDVAVSFNNIQLLNFLQNFKTMEKNFWYLWYASVHGSTSIVENLLDEGFRDECVKCNLSLNNDEVYRGMYEHFLEYSTTKTNTYDSANAYKFRRFFLCESALLVAVKRGKYKVVKTLLLSGSQCLEHTDAFGFTPLGAAVYFRHDSVIKLLLSYGANVNFVVKSLLNSSDVDIFNRFLRFPLEKKWNTQNAFNGATIFHLSALKPTCSSTILLGEILQTQKNTNLDVKDSNGHSPLYYAICHPEADNTYATMEDFLQSKSHRMVFFLIEAFNSQQISDSLLKLGICGRRRHLYSQVFISSKYKDQFCKHETNFPQLKELSSITELKAESDFGMSSNFIAFNEEKLMSSDCMVFMLRQLPQTIFDFKDFVKNIHDKYGENAYIYIKAYPGPGSSVTFDGC